MKKLNRSLVLGGLVLALATRVGLVLATGDRLTLPLRDQGIYHHLARSLTEGNGLSLPSAPDPLIERQKKSPGQNPEVSEIKARIYEKWERSGRFYGIVPFDSPTSFWEPLYPLFVASLYSVFGQSFLAVKLAQAVLGTLVCLFVYVVGKRSIGEMVGLLALYATAVYPFFLYYVPLLMWDTLFIFLLWLALYLFYVLKEKPNTSIAILLGLSAGAAILTRSLFLLFLPPMGLCLLVYENRKQLLPLIGVIGLAAIAVIVPWIVRNYKVHHAFIVTSTRGGYNLWMRNNPLFIEDELAKTGVRLPAGWIEQIQGREFLEFPDLEAESEIDRNAEITSRAWKFIKNNPKFFLLLCWNRLKEFLGVAGYTAHGGIYRLTALFWYGLFLPLALAGMVMTRGAWRKLLVLYLLIIFFVSVHSVLHGNIRYRIAIDPCLILFACAPVAELLRFCTHKREETLA